jgi:hypothetical protein
MIFRLALVVSGTLLGFLLACSDGLNSTEWLVQDVSDQLQAILENKAETQARDLTNGALATVLLSKLKKPNSSSVGSGQIISNACDTAIGFLHQFGGPYDMSFGGEPIPAFFNEYYHTCFDEPRRAKDKEFFLAAINASLPQTRKQVTGQEVSYTNMYLMATTTTILMGELAEQLPGMKARALISQNIGYEMWEEWLHFTEHNGFHEFLSPTYTNVQLSALYLGYMYAKRTGAREQFESVLDYLWAEIAANYYPPSGAMSGPHSRDYDFLLSHGMAFIDMFVQKTVSGHRLPKMPSLKCEFHDPHCEGSPMGWNSSIGTGEPMTVIAITLLNEVHPRGYRIKNTVISLATMGPDRVVRSRFLGPDSYVTANGQFGKFGDTYNFIHIDGPDFRSGYAIGSASQDYITNTHSKYFPYSGEKIVNIVLGSMYALENKLSKNMNRGKENDERLQVPTISIQPDFMDSPYGLPRNYPKWQSTDKGTHLAMHPGNVQKRNVLLTTMALDTLDFTDAYPTSPMQKLGSFLSLTTNIILPLRATEFWLAFPNGTSRTFSVPRSPFSLVIPLGTTVGLRVDSGGLAFKVFHLDGIEGLSKPWIELCGEMEGMVVGAVRVACHHYASSNGFPRILNATHVRFGALMIAETVRGHDELKKLTQRVFSSKISSVKSTDGQYWDVHASRFNTSDASSSLYIRRNLSCSEHGGQYNQSLHTQWNCLLDRRIDGVTVQPTTLEVNGVKIPFRKP